MTAAIRGTFSKAMALNSILYNLPLAHRETVAAHEDDEPKFWMRETNLIEDSEILRMWRELQSSDILVQARGHSRLMIALGAIVHRFHWLVRNHNDEIMGWYDAKKLCPVRRAIERRYKVIDSNAPCFVFPTSDPRNVSMHLAAMIIMAELFSYLPPVGESK
ncbi:MAG: hypothetical protein V4526_01715 [Patescibacteria group bacterium]